MSSSQEVPASDIVFDEIATKALDVFEKGVAKEKTGSMSDAVKYYRQALKIHSDVERLYRQKLQQEWELHKLEQNIQSVRIEDEHEETPALPCYLLEILSDDILLNIISLLVETSAESWTHFALTCKRVNALCFQTSTPFRIMAQAVYPKQIYDSESAQLNGIVPDQMIMAERWDNNWYQMLCDRPFLKFEGLYISVCNYLRYGANAEGSNSLLQPIQMITYYRYFRFYEDGTVYKLCSSEEPQHVVPTFHKERRAKNAQIGRWRITADGTCIISTVGYNDYMFTEELEIKNLGRKKHHKLSWIASYYLNGDGERCDFNLTKEKGFTFSRVRSYTK